MNVLHIDTERTWRGGEQQVFSLVDGLERLGHHTATVVRRGSALERRLAGAGFAVEPVSPMGEWDVWAARRVRRAIERHGARIVHAHTAHGAALGALALLGRPEKLVVSRRVDFPLSRNPFSRWKYRQADRIVAISENVRRVLVADGIEPARLSVIPSGIDFRRYAGIRPLTRAGMGVSDGPPLIGQVAALADHKDQSTFLRALGLLRDRGIAFVAVLVGEGSERRTLEAERSRLGLGEAVLFAGYQTNPLEWMAAFDVFCLSSKLEGLGTSILDAMALGIPVVATEAGGIPEMIAHGRTGWLAAPQDPVSLADQLADAIAAPDKRRRMASAAAEKVRNFDVLRTLELTEALYQDLN